MNKNVWLLSACQTLMMVNNTLLLTTSALVGLVLSHDASYATLPLALQFFASMLMTIPASFLMKRLGRRAGFQIGLVIGFVGGLLATMAILQSQFWLFCLGALLIGSFNGFGNYYRFAAVDAVNEANRSRAISYVLAGGVIAAVIGPNLANWTHNSIAAAEYAGSFVVIMVVYLLSFAVISFTTLGKVTETAVDTRRSRPLLMIVRQPLYIVALIGSMLGYAVMSLVMTATPLAMSHHHGLSDTAFVIEWHVLGMFAPSFVTGRLIARYGVQNIMLIGALLLLLTVVVNLMGNSLWHYWFALLCLGVGWNFLFIGGTDLLTYTYNENEKARAQAFNDFSVFAAVSFSALTAGYLQHQFGWQIVNIGVLPFIGIILLALIWLRFFQSSHLLQLHQVKS